MDLDLEKLKLVLDMLGGMGTDTVGLVKLYLWVTLSTDLFETIAWSVVILAIVWKLTTCIRAYGVAESALKQIRDVFWKGKEGELSLSEIAAIHREINRIMVKLGECQNQNQKEDRKDAVE